MKILKILTPFILVLTLFSCGSDQNNVSIQTQNVPGFDVTNFANLVKTTKDPQSLEQAINVPGNNINNLDLNHDGNVDYVKVVEVGHDSLQVLDDVSPTSTITIATLSITSQNNTANVVAYGNPTYCGDNYQYRYHSSLTDFLILSYLMRPHVYYHPSYHYGYYPSYYSSRRVVSTRVITTSNGSYNRKSLSSPTSSQRAFQVRDNRPVKSGGFGGSPTPARSSSFGSSRSSFGTSHSSSFGRRH
jgi:hypothetical protein